MDRKPEAPPRRFKVIFPINIVSQLVKGRASASVILEYDLMVYQS
jgi:hypothetical protein